MDIRKMITDYINAELLTSPIEDLDSEMDIIQTGLLDSISIVRLLVYIEDTFNISLDDSLEMDNFRTVKKIVSLIESKQQNT